MPLKRQRMYVRGTKHLRPARFVQKNKIRKAAQQLRLGVQLNKTYTTILHVGITATNVLIR